MATYFKRPHARTAALSAPTLQQATTNPRLCWRPVDAHGQVWISLLWVTAPFSWVLVHTGFVCPLQEPVSPVLYKFWQLYGGVNGDLLQEGLCHTQVYCAQSPCPCSSPLLTRTSTGDTQTQVCLSLCRVSGSWCAKGLFEPFEHLWWVWGLILNADLSLLPSCWCFSLALDVGYLLSPALHSCCSSAGQLPLQRLSFCWGFSALGLGYLLKVIPVPPQRSDIYI